MKLVLLLFLLSFNVHALEYSKIEYEGCPENSYCKKETGATRKKWLEQLKNFSKGLINEQKINAYIQNEYGLPISGWAQEEASLLPNILMWDSPCKQHKNSANKYYIDEIFRKNLSQNELKEIPTAIFSHVIVQEAGKPTYSITVPRGDAPLFFKDGSLYYLRDEEGMYYGLLIDREGHLKVIKNETTSVTPKEVTCTKEMISEYLRLAPSPNFYQGQFCKEIWDKTTKSFKTVILGWSCN